MSRLAFVQRVLIGTLAGTGLMTRSAQAHDLEPQRQLVRDWASAFNARDFKKLRALLSANYINHNPHVPSGADATIKFLQSVAATLPEARLSVDDIITEGQKIASRMTLSSKADGNVNKGTVIDIWRVENGRLAEHWDSAG